MIAVDSNILIYARREESRFHARARAVLTDLAEGESPWAIPWPCIYEFIKVVTHLRIFENPTPLDAAVETVEAILDSPTLVMLGHGPGHRRYLRAMILDGAANGNRAHDAHIAALLLEHGVKELLSADRDMTRFPGIRVTHPFARPPP